ncbi:hypothetical protein [Aeromonas hydrophila]|uniref:hypothetical protein n=1 Tax=Aeromonas TaxID=642 RepID=UPI00044C9EB2|nr:hypothetical protein [Aeromonas hydrophila]EZH81720.1 hypothetical protein AT59_13730 [Aeromonas hydrophila AD9]
MKANDLKLAADAGKNAGTILGQIDEFVDSVADDFEKKRYCRGGVKAIGGLVVVVLLGFAISKFPSGSVPAA